MYLATSKYAIMKIRKITLYILCVIVAFVSCNKDDGGFILIEVPIVDRTEQQVIDKDSLIGYLETHYYNSSVFVGNMNPSINDLVITELADGETNPPVDHTLLIDAIEFGFLESFFKSIFVITSPLITKNDFSSIIFPAFFIAPAVPNGDFSIENFIFMPIFFTDK